MLRHLSRIRDDERGAALITALLCTMIMLALGMALLSIVDTQASESATERTRDKAFNLSESVLNSQAFVLGRNWPTSNLSARAGNNPCSVTAAGFGWTVGGGASADSDTERLRPNINASYTDDWYAGASWQANVCDDFTGSTVWTDTVYNNVGYDANANNKLWVRAESTVGGVTRALVGLVDVRSTAALKSRYGLVAGNVAEDVSQSVSTITNATVLSGVSEALLGTSPPVAEDPLFPPVGGKPQSGVTGLRCGLLENVTQVKTCVTGAIGALSQVPAINTLVTGGKYEQYPTTQSTSAASIGQLRAQAKTAPGVYKATTSGSNSVTGAPSCAISGATTDSVVFIEKIGTGDQYCYVDVSTSVRYKALVIGSGRVIIRGNNTTAAYNAAGASNLFTGVVYALNEQTTNLSATSPIRELVRIERGARVRGAVHADGKNATVAVIPPDFDTATVVSAVLCPALCALAPTVNGLLGSLGVNGTINALINGTCLVSLPLLGCTVSLPGQGVTGITKIVNNITSQLTTYGSAIRSDVGVIGNLKVYGASGISPGTFRDLTLR